MPYRWPTPTQSPQILELWPHRSLPRKGFAAIVMMAFTLGTVPLYGLLGTVVLWGILPFILLVVAALWWGLERSYRDANVYEVLTLVDDDLVLTHTPVRGPDKVWSCNIYWARAELHIKGGPVPHYVTLSGNGRTVEIGSFLSEDERKALFTELQSFLKNHRA